MEELVSVQDLTVEFPTEQGTVHAVNRISFSVGKGEVLGVVGESGSGKSTAAYAMMGLLGGRGRVTSGSISFEGRSMLSLSKKELQAVRGGEIGMIFQDPMQCLDPMVTIGKQMTEMVRAHSLLNKREAEEVSAEMLRRVGINEPKAMLSRYQHELSGGMRQRVMIAMMLSTKPKLLIADEPTTALDVTIQDQIIGLLKDACRENDMSMLFITHNFGLVADICDRVCVMYGGHIVEEGTVEEIFYYPTHPYTRGLLSAIPEIRPGERKRLASISGAPNNAFNPPEGCIFSPRCDRCRPECTKRAPEARDISITHRVACHWAESEAMRG